MTTDELRNKMCIPADASKDDIVKTFGEIAEILLLHTEIAIGENIRYTIEEIEFYYFREGSFNGPEYYCTYPRKSSACDFFFHYSGVDICFESTKNSFGGVLIRSLKRAQNGNKELICGPMRCSIELMNRCTQIGHMMDLIVNEQTIKEGTPQNTIRQGIRADYEVKEGKVTPNVQYCYYIPQNNSPWIGIRNLDLEQYKLIKESERTKKITKNDKTYKYQDNPKDRVDNINQMLQKKK